MPRTKSAATVLALVALVLPSLAAAHNDTTDWLLDGVISNVDKPTNGANRVSGVYYGSVNLMNVHNGPTVRDVSTSYFASTGGLTHRLLCDFEVLSSGDNTGDALDEVEVDGSPGGTAPTLYDDGGIGGACHTHTGYYGEPSYNTPGCDYDPAFADDASGLGVWLTTRCDYAYPTSGFGMAYYLLECTYGAIRTTVDKLTNCGPAVLGCLLDPVVCVLSTGQACGADSEGIGSIKTTDQGGWSYAGVPFDPVPLPCTDEDGAAEVLVWTAVFVDSTVPLVDVSAPTVGVIF